ncbi:MAG TPA: hypothetical protein VNV66_11340 [Pilimelia sp.]|nr:hypothetical protein [Pilimelia sp.]
MEWEARRTVAGVAGGAVAAFLGGTVFARVGTAELRYATYLDIAPGEVRAGSLLPAVAALVVAAACLIGRRAAWPVAAGGLTLTAAATWVTTDVGRPVPGAASSVVQLMPLALSTLGAAAALAGVLAALGRTPAVRSRMVVGSALAGGVALGPWLVDLPARLGHWPPGWPPPGEGAAWLGVAAALAAAVLGAAAAGPAGDGAAATGPTGDGPARGSLVVVVVAGAVVCGLWLRKVVVNAFRLSPDGLASPRREQAVEAFGHYCAVAVALTAALVLAGYAYRSAGARAARFVVLGGAAAGPTLAGVPTAVPGAASVVAPVVVAVAAVAGGAALVRFADGGFPWDALGLVTATLGMLLGHQAVRAELPALGWTPPALVLGGLGLALSAGVVGVVVGPRAATSAAAREIRGRGASRVGVLSLGLAGFVLVGHALSSVVVTAELSWQQQGLPLTVPVIAVGAAVLLGLLFGFDRAVDRIRRDVAAAARRPG